MEANCQTSIEQLQNLQIVHAAAVQANSTLRAQVHASTRLGRRGNASMNWWEMGAQPLAMMCCANASRRMAPVNTARFRYWSMRAMMSLLSLFLFLFFSLSLSLS